jgi:hypothetical protein
LLLAFSKSKVETRAVPQVVLVVIIPGPQVLKARQEILQLNRPETNMLAYLDVQASAGGHAKSGFRLRGTQKGTGRYHFPARQPRNVSIFGVFWAAALKANNNATPINVMFLIISCDLR